MKALIGYSGFVGGNLKEQDKFDLFFNSKNIGDIRGKKIETLVCAGVSGIKWLANKEPENDFLSIFELVEKIKTASIKKVILISTIDVYPETTDVDESFVINKDKLLPYGRNRRIFEEFIENNYDHLIVRLPGLFGRGLKKNPIFDLSTKQTKYINKNSTYQFYNLANLSKDIGKAVTHDLKIINLVPEPISINDAAKNIFNLELPENEVGITKYDIRSKYAEYWNQDASGYLYNKKQTMDDLTNFASYFKPEQN
jgi:nucleoside-diphosphate-sugar epimerase